MYFERMLVLVHFMAYKKQVGKVKREKMRRVLKIFSTKPYIRVLFFCFKMLDLYFAEAKSCYFFCLNVFGSIII